MLRCARSLKGTQLLFCSCLGKCTIIGSLREVYYDGSFKIDIEEVCLPVALVLLLAFRCINFSNYNSDCHFYCYGRDFSLCISVMPCRLRGGN
jgi:hypothetical protein